MSQQAALSKHLKSCGNKVQTNVGIIGIGASIGAGGNGVVYEGLLHKQKVAVKFLVSDSSGYRRVSKMKRFLAEYLNIIFLDNQSGLVRYLGYFELDISPSADSNIVPMVIMKRYEGSLVSMRSRFKVKDISKLYEFLIDTVGRIHNNGIIHRDIKPENILVLGSNFYLCDFGIANFDSNHAISPTTNPKENMNNRFFSAPEQDIAGAKAHSTMDIYAIGQVLHWFIHGAPHKGSNRPSIGVSENEFLVYDLIIDKCLSYDLRNRFQSVKEIESFRKDYILNNVARVDPFKYLIAFGMLMGKVFPKCLDSVMKYDNIGKINKFMHELAGTISQYDQFLIWMDGYAQLSIKSIDYVHNNRWRIDIDEYIFTSLYVYSDLSSDSDIVMLRYEKDTPFNNGSPYQYYSIMLDGKHGITQEEYDNGYAEIGDELVELDKDKVMITRRKDKWGFLIIATTFTNINTSRAVSKYMDFISPYLDGSLVLDEKSLYDFILSIKGYKHPDVARLL